MSIAVHLYSFTKRENSTKRPSSGGTTYNCVLIDETSLMNPVFKLDIGSNPIGKNYAYVPDFDRYYFITDTCKRRAVDGSNKKGVNIRVTIIDIQSIGEGNVCIVDL